VQYAEKLGYRLKLLGIARRTNGGVELRVHPTLIPERRLIANVDGTMNAVLVKGDAVGPTLFYGAGAGAEPTASAVVADLDEIGADPREPEHVLVEGARRLHVLGPEIDVVQAAGLEHVGSPWRAGPIANSDRIWIMERMARICTRARSGSPASRSAVECSRSTRRRDAAARRAAS